MTKQEAIDMTRTLIEALEALPDEADILIAEVTEYSTPNHLNIHLNSGIEAVSDSTGGSIRESHPECSEYIHRELSADGCDYVQLENMAYNEAAPGVTSTEGG